MQGDQPAGIGAPQGGATARRFLDAVEVAAFGAGVDHDVERARRNRIDADHGTVLCDHHPNPESRVIERQNTDLAKRVLNSLPKREREVLTRFYLREQSPRQICRDMSLTETQFRLTKSRAKARFTELGRARLARRNGFIPHGCTLEAKSQNVAS